MFLSCRKDLVQCTNTSKRSIFHKFMSINDKFKHSHDELRSLYLLIKETVKVGNMLKGTRKCIINQTTISSMEEHNKIQKQFDQ